MSDDVMNRMKLYICIISCALLFMLLFTQSRSGSYAFLYYMPDAYLSASAGADIAAPSVSSLVNNISASVFSDKRFEASFSILGEALGRYSSSFSFLKPVGKGMLGFKSLYLFSPADTKDPVNTIDGTPFSGFSLYSGIYGGISYSFLLNKMIKDMNIPLAFGCGMNYAGEFILGRGKAALLFDSGMTLPLFKNKLFLGCAVNNIGFSFDGSFQFFRVNAGVKYIFDLFKVPIIHFMGTYSIDELMYHSAAIGMNIVVNDIFYAGAGYRFDAGGDAELIHDLFYTGIGVQIKEVSFNVSCIPFSVYNAGIFATLQYRKKDIPYQFDLKEIKSFSLERLVKLARMAIKEKNWQAAFVLIKEGLLIDPDNQELFDLLNILKDNMN
ncbi:hypothetical protein ACFL6D_03060 [Spirochaetota bacterium]